MQEPGFPANEAYRLSALQELNLLDTMAEERFDRLTRIAQRLFDTPIVLIVLIDQDRQWFKSAIGVDIPETPRSIALCAHTILQDHALVVNDTLQDPRFSDNPLVTGPPNVRFYAGQPIFAPNGEAVGTICIADMKPRDFSDNDVELLTSLGELVEKEMNHPDLQALSNRLKSEQDLLDHLAQLRLSEKHQRLRNKVLELISRGYPLHEVLNAVVSDLEDCNSNIRACIEIQPANGDKLQRYWGHNTDQIHDFDDNYQHSQLI
ncbi:MAG: GAF domain-containing protein, partial [Pseudomonadota bacterium]